MGHTFIAQQGRNDGGKGGTIPQATNHYWGTEKSQRSHKYFLSLNIVHLLSKNLKFEHGGAKLASCPGRHLASIRPCSTILM